MKFIFINSNKQWGGGEKWHYDAAHAMKARGHQVCILTLKNSELFRRSLVAEIPVIPFRISNLSFLNPFLIRKLCVLFKHEQPDAIILNFSADVKTAGLAARIASVRHIIYRRGNAKPIKNTLSNRILFRHVITHMITNSLATRQSVLQNNPALFPEEKIQIIYNGIDIKAFDNQSYDLLLKPEKKEIIIGSAGRLSPEKGQHFLIQMANQLKDDNYSFKLLIAGEGPLRQELEREAKSSEAAGQIVFTGFIKNMKSFMESIDIFVLPSRWEGFGYVSIEAMACGKPVVAFHTGSNPEIIEHEKTGFLVKDLNVQAMTGYVRLLIINAQLRKSMGMAGRKRTEELFDLGRVEDSIEAFLTSLSA